MNQTIYDQIRWNFNEIMVGEMCIKLSVTTSWLCENVPQRPLTWTLWTWSANFSLLLSLSLVSPSSSFSHEVPWIFLLRCHATIDFFSGCKFAFHRRGSKLMTSFHQFFLWTFSFLTMSFHIIYSNLSPTRHLKSLQIFPLLFIQCLHFQSV